MKLIKLFAVMALAASTSAFAAPVCNDITTFPTVEKVVNGKTYQVPKCVATCLQVTPYTSPRCVDYDNVLALRPRSTDSNIHETPTLPVSVNSTPLGSIVPNTGPVSCLDTTTFPQVSKGGVTFPVCVTECAKSTVVSAVGAVVKSSTTIVVSPTDALTVKPKMIVTGDWIVANTKVVSVDTTTGAIVVSIPVVDTKADDALSFTTPGIVPPVCVSFSTVAP